LERHIFTGAGTAEHPAGLSTKLEKVQGFKASYTARDESVVTKSGTELVFRTYTPKTQDAFRKLATDPNFTPVRNAAGALTFMQTGAAKFYLHTAKGASAGIARAYWADGKMAEARQPDSFRSADTQARQVAQKGDAGTVAGYVKQGHLQEVKLPTGGKGYKVVAGGANGDKAWNALHKAGYSYRQRVGDSEVWMNQSTWQKMQRH
jgi:hypothetical protein